MWEYTTLVFLFNILHNGNTSEVFLNKVLITEGELIQKGPFNDESLIECVIDLTQITIIFTPTILILKDEEDDIDDTFFNKMIETFATRDVPITIQDQNNYVVNQTLDVYDGNVIVIVHFDDCDALLNFDIGNVDKKVKHLIIITEATKDSLISLQKVDRRFIERDITFIIQNLTAKRHSIITFLPQFDGNTCSPMEKIDSTQINVCSNGSLETDVVFPDGIKVDFKNCSLKVGMASMFPFSKIPNKDKLKNYDLIEEIEGSDVEITKIITSYFNASPVWYYLLRSEQNPFSDMEYVQFMANGSFDACAGGLYRIYGDIMSYSGIYTRQAVVWIYTVHRSSRSWVNLVRKLNGMYLFYSFYICYSVLTFLFSKYDRQRLSFEVILLNSWGSLIGGGSLPEPKSLKHKILNIFYLLSCMYLSTYMNIQLISFLTIDGPSVSFKTNDDVIHSGRTPYLNEKHKNFIEDMKYLTFANTSGNCGDFYDCSDSVLFNDGVTAILDEYFYPLQAATAVKDEAKILRATDNIVTIYQEMLINKQSLILVGFQKVLNRLFEAGICEHLFEEAIGITVVAKAKSANMNALSNNYSCESGCAITLAQVAGVFFVWAAGCCLSLCVFLLEIVCKRQRNVFKAE